MPEYLAPGVFVEETTFRAKPIEGVGTSTAGFVGPCRYGRVVGPGVAVTSMSEFENAYGGGAPLEFSTQGSLTPTSTSPLPNYMWHAARAFFAEGGKRLHVARAFRPLAGTYPPTAAPVDVGTAGSPAWSDGHGRYSDGTLAMRARFPGAAGNLIVRLTLQAGADNPLLGQDLTLGIEILSSDGAHSLGRWIQSTLDPTNAAFGAKGSEFARFSANSECIDASPPTPLIIDGPVDSELNTAEFVASWFADELALAAADLAAGDTIATRLTRGVTREVQLTGGNDGLRPRAAEYAGAVGPEEAFRTGLRQLEIADDVSIVAAPGATQHHASDPADVAEIYSLLIDHAERMRYRIAVLDSPPGIDVREMVELRSRLDSSHAAIYYPWITIADPITGGELDLPPSGFVAGIYARNDVQRGVYKAPANEVVTLAVNLERAIDKEQQDLLNPKGVNCLRHFEGRGIRVWGARTISSDPEWKYVNVRRYFAYIEQSIDRGTQWAVFEPNGEALWANVRRTIEDFLLAEWRNGAMLGDRPDKAFFVKCDRTTMTQNDLDNGRLVCLIGVAPLRPAEFVIVRIGQWTADRKDG